MAGNDVFLYSVPSDANRNDVRLRNPNSIGAAAYEITALSSAVTLTGTSVVLKVGRNLAATSSAIAIAASTAGLSKGSKVSAVSSAVTLTGSTVTVAKASKVLAVSGAITLTGSTVTLSVGRNLAVVSSALTLAGSTVDLVYTAGTAPVRERSDGFAIYYTGEGKRAVYQRLIDEIEASIEKPPEKKSAKKKARKIVEEVEAIAPDEIPVWREQIAAPQFDYGAFAHEVLEFVRQREEAARRKRRIRSVAVAMLMAA